jgi:pimeloyl-ACP methyl ester carboxylesterase
MDFRPRSPVLFVHDEQSVIPTWSTADTAALIPGAEVVVVPGCGHFPWAECPGSVRRPVVQALRRLW